MLPFSLRQPDTHPRLHRCSCPSPAASLFWFVLSFVSSFPSSLSSSVLFCFFLFLASLSCSLWCSFAFHISFPCFRTLLSLLWLITRQRHPPHIESSHPVQVRVIGRCMNLITLSTRKR
jgi:hypothetical protein